MNIDGSLIEVIVFADSGIHTMLLDRFGGRRVAISEIMTGRIAVLEDAPQVVLITGGARGIGFETAQAFAKKGNRIILADIDGSALSSAKDQLQSAGYRVHIIEVDIASESSVAAMYAFVDRSYSRLDVLVHSAAVIGRVDNKIPRIEHMPLDVWNRVIGINLTGTFLVNRGAVPLMKRNGWGRIINIASTAGRMRIGDVSYSSSKTGVLGFSRWLAGDVARDGITVNSVAPTQVATGMTASFANDGSVERKIAENPTGRLATTQDVAAAVLFLASEEASFITGTVIDVNGGSFMQ